MTSTTCQYGCRKYGLVGTVENALGPDAGVSKYFCLISTYATAKHKRKAAPSI